MKSDETHLTVIRRDAGYLAKYGLYWGTKHAKKGMRRKLLLGGTNALIDYMEEEEMIRLNGDKTHTQNGHPTFYEVGELIYHNSMKFRYKCSFPKKVLRYIIDTF